MGEDGFNYLLLGLIVLAIINVVRGCRKGMVKALISLVSLVILCLVVTLLAHGISGYNDGKYFNVILMIILLTVIAVVHILLGVLFFSAKLVVKLPVVHFVDKLLGIVFGLAETVLILWTIYTFTMMMDLGRFEELILAWTGDNTLLTWLYQHNFLAHGIGHILQEFSFIPLEKILSVMQ